MRVVVDRLGESLGILNKSMVSTYDTVNNIRTLRKQSAGILNLLKEMQADSKLKESKKER
jgi:hypothetical protein